MNEPVCSRSRLIPVVMLLVLASAPAAAQEPVTPQLTDKLDRLLREEMRSIQTAMGTIHTAMVMGHHDTVAAQARAIHDSFILQQSLTEQDRKDLEEALPEAFIRLDQRFHELGPVNTSLDRRVAAQNRARQGARSEFSGV